MHSYGAPIVGLLSAISLGGVPGAAAQFPSPPAIALDMSGPDMIRGETPVLVSFSTTAEAYVLVFRVDTDGRIRFLYPIQPAGDTLVPAGGPYHVVASPEAHANVSFVSDEYPGIGYLFAIASRDRFSLDPYVYRGRWNRHALMPGGRVRGDPYAAFTELVAGLLPESGDYGYDVLPYTVGSRYRVPRFACYGCHAGPGYPWRDDYRDWCATFRIDLTAEIWSRFPIGLVGIDAVSSTQALPASIYVYTRRGEPSSVRPSDRDARAGSSHRAGGIARDFINQLIGSLIRPDATRVRGGDESPRPRERPRLERRTKDSSRAAAPPRGAPRPTSPSKTERRRRQ